MSARPRIGLGALAAFAALALFLSAPGTASAHAYLIRTSPTASGVLNSPPTNVSLTFDEAVEPRFATISVTNVNGTQETTAAGQSLAVEPRHARSCRSVTASRRAGT